MNTQAKDQTKEANYERVNEFEYDRKHDKAKINIKVGNVVGTITVRRDWEGNISVVTGSKIGNLQDAGMELNFEPLKEDFQKLYDKVQEEKKQEARERARKAWENSWVNNVEKPNVEGLEFKIEDKDNFVERMAEGRSTYNRSPRFSVLYRGEEVSIRKENVGRRYNKNVKYQISHKITDHNRRNYGAPENAVEKIVELVDEKIEREQREKERKAEAKQKRQDKLKRLKEEFGAFGEPFVDRVWTRHSTYRHKFYLKINEDTKYPLDEHHREEGHYNFGSFSKVTADQVRSMLEILHPEVN